VTINLDDELAVQYLSDSCEHLVTAEAELLAIEEGGPNLDEVRVNRVFRAVHSIKGGAGFFDLLKIRELAHQMENVLALIRSRTIAPTAARVSVLLRATDKLNEMVRNPGTSNQADLGEITVAFAELPTTREAEFVQMAPDEPETCAGQTGSGVRLGGAATSVSAVGIAPVNRARNGRGRLRVLIVEDDFACRLLLQTFLSRYGDCHIAVNGREAVDAFRSAFEQGQGYDLLCMDIMMPEMDGREAVRQIRAQEEAHGILSTSGARIIMTTAVDDIKEVILCFKDLCDGYLVKPIDLAELLKQMRSHRLVR
jgi:two-component system chemotaxis response regulator CheY